VCGVVVEEASREGRGHGFEPRQPRSVATLHENLSAGGWGLSYIKKFFLFIFSFYVLTRKTIVLAGDLSAR
jgi:hypothetical protein